MRVIRAVVEYNDSGFLVYADNYCGAFTRGKTKEEALGKLPDEIRRYHLWATEDSLPQNEPLTVMVVREKISNLQIRDADSDIIFETEKPPLSLEEYSGLRTLVMKSARDFEALYLSVPDKNYTTLPARQTFYGAVPRTAFEMYQHTNGVTDYYVGEIGITVDNLSNIVENRINALRCIESTPFFLTNALYTGSYEEQWSLRKVLRRFVWHDRIHAQAMYKMASNIWGKQGVKNPFFFD